MAYKIYISEDEPPILRDIIQKIENLGQGFEIVGYANNGEDAYKEINVLHPDLVLTDIHMPVIDGLSLIQKVKTDFPEMICLILSGYKDFEYARQALKLGVEDFIVKPLSMAQLSDALNQAKLKLDGMYKDKMHTLLHDMIKYEKSELDLTLLPFRRLDLFYLCLNNPINRAAELKTYHNQISELWDSIHIEKKVLEFTDNATTPHWILDIGFENEKLIIFAGQNSVDKQGLWESIQAHAQANQYYITATYHTCILQSMSFIAEIKSCRKTTRNRAIIGCQQLFHLEPDCTERINDWMLGPSDEHILAILCRNNQHRSFVEHISILLENWEFRGITSLTLEANLLEVLKIMERNSNLIEHLQEQKHEMIIENMFLTCNTMLAIKTQYFSAIEQIFSAKTDMNKTDYGRIVLSVCEYMENNFASKMSLREISDQFGLTESHLCKLFKKHKNESPIDYLLRIRVDNAKRIMDSHDSVMIKEIAEMVGFSDQYYFSRMFRNQTGLSPSEYKNNLSR